MEEGYMPFAASPPSAPPPESYAPLTTSAFSENKDDSDEWEYEYSTTDTDTFYVTLDLTTPDAARDRQPRFHKPPKKPIWTNPGISRNKKRGNLAMPMTFGAPDARDTSPAEIPAGTMDDDEREADEWQAPVTGDDGELDELDDNQNGDPETPATQGYTETPAEEDGYISPDKVQILDLHTDNPLVSYDGQVFSCEWARNIGTEMIFADEESAANLLALRHLPNGAVLLAASSARIISKPLIVEPKTGQEEEVVPRKKRKQRNQTVEGIQTDPGAKSAGLQSQASFLQRMMAIKKVKGEEDRVTMKVEPRKSYTMWKSEWMRFVTQEQARLRQIMARGSGEEVLEARRKWEELQKENELVVAKRRNRGTGKAGVRNPRAAGRPRKIRFDLDEEANAVEVDDRVDEDMDEDLLMEAEDYDALTDMDVPFEDDDDTQMQEEFRY